MDYRQISRFLAVGRAAVGVVALVAPGLVLRSLGTGTDGGARLVTRAFAGRELALAVGTLRSLDRDPRSHAWVRASAAADVVDAGAALAGLRALGPARSLGGAAVAAGAAVVGLRAADRLD